MYPSQMLKHEMPVGKITKFESNPLKTGDSFKSLCDQHAFIKCTVFVDKSLNIFFNISSIIIVFNH